MTTGLRRVGVRVSTFFRRSTVRPLSSVRLPELEYYDTPREVTIRVATGDFDPKDIEVHLKGRLLTLVGKELKQEPGRLQSAAYRRSILLPEGIDSMHSRAKYKGKKMVIRLPKDAAA